VAVLVRAERRTPTEKVVGGLLEAAAVECAVLAVTGVYLTFFYHPASRGVVEVVRVVHRDTAGVMIVTLWGLLVVASGFWLGRRRRLARWRKVMVPVAIGLVLAALLASFGGYRISWNQLALWQGTSVSDFRGFRVVIWHPSQVAYAVVGASRISVDTVRVWLLLHVVVIPLALVALGLVAARRLGAPRDQRDRHTGLESSTP
jgi:hypothetical protein